MTVWTFEQAARLAYEAIRRKKFMTTITYEQWQERFMVNSDPDEWEYHIKDDPERFSFFSNGAVKDNQSGDYVIKLDQVERLAK